uniref:Glycerol dehydrogenase n=1 Tax=Pseudomonas aeruginosa TaxID=287 RepID=A0A649Z442_PSEAI|nr:Glycerol dehydrogenase [Pseudomonas aeruginosa]
MPGNLLSLFCLPQQLGNPRCILLHPRPVIGVCLSISSGFGLLLGQLTSQRLNLLCRLTTSHIKLGPYRLRFRVRLLQLASVSFRCNLGRLFRRRQSLTQLSQLIPQRLDLHACVATGSIQLRAHGFVGISSGPCSLLSGNQTLTQLGQLDSLRLPMRLSLTEPPFQRFNFRLRLVQPCLQLVNRLCGIDQLPLRLLTLLTSSAQHFGDPALSSLDRLVVQLDGQRRKSLSKGSSQKTESMVTPVFATPILTINWAAAKTECNTRPFR